MSMIPVYEALARLESEYLVQNVPRSGTRVRIPSHQDLLGFFAVRVALETQAARLFVRNATTAERTHLVQSGKDVDTARQLIAHVERPSRDRVNAWRSLHMGFHHEIVERANLPMLTEAVERNQLLVFNYFYDQTYGDLPLPDDWHEQLATALAGHSEMVADEAMRAHLENRLTDLLRCLDELLVANTRSGRRKTERTQPAHLALARPSDTVIAAKSGR